MKREWQLVGDDENTSFEEICDGVICEAAESLEDEACVALKWH